MTRAYFSPPYMIIILVLMAVLAWIFGWIVILYGLLLFVLITAGTAVYDFVTHEKTCRQCKAAARYLKSREPTWECWTAFRSHRAMEDTRMVVAVFYKAPNQMSIPTPYKLISVDYALQEIYELDDEESKKYRIKNYK